jgi:hypothetical protein
MAKITNPLAITNVAEVAVTPSPDFDSEQDLIDGVSEDVKVSEHGAQEFDLEKIVEIPAVKDEFFKHALQGLYNILPKIAEEKNPLAALKRKSDFRFVLYALKEKQGKDWTADRLYKDLKAMYNSGALDDLIVEKQTVFDKLAGKYRNSKIAKAVTNASGKVSEIKETLSKKYANSNFKINYLGKLADKKQAKELLKMQRKSAGLSIWSSWKKQERELLKTDGNFPQEYQDFLDILHKFGYKSEAAVRKAYEANPNDPNLTHLEFYLHQYDLYEDNHNRSENPLIRSKQILCEASFKSRKKEPEQGSLEHKLFAKKAADAIKKLEREFGELSALSTLSRPDFVSYNNKILPVEAKIRGALGIFGLGVEALYIPDVNEFQKTIDYIYSGSIKKEIRANLNHLEAREYKQLGKFESSKAKPLENERYETNKQWILENCGPLAKEYMKRWEAYEALLEARNASLVDTLDLIEESYKASVSLSDKAAISYLDFSNKFSEIAKSMNVELAMPKCKAKMRPADGVYKQFSKFDKNWQEYCTREMRKIFTPIEGEAQLLHDELHKIESPLIKYHKANLAYQVQEMCVLAQMNLAKDPEKDQYRFAKIMLEDRVEDAVKHVLENGLGKRKEEVKVYDDAIALAKLLGVNSEKILKNRNEKNDGARAYRLSLKLAGKLEGLRSDMLTKQPAYVAENFLKQMYILNNLGVNEIADLENALEDVKESGSRECTLVYSPTGYEWMGGAKIPIESRVEADEKDGFYIKYKNNGKKFTYGVQDSEIYTKDKKICESCIANKGMTKQKLIDHWNAEKTKQNSTIIANNAVYALALAYKNSSDSMSKV